MGSPARGAARLQQLSVADDVDDGSLCKTSVLFIVLHGGRFSSIIFT